MPGFSSSLHPGEVVLGDHSPMSDFAPPPGKGRGLLARPYGAAFSDLSSTNDFPEDWYIDDSEWQDRIAEMERDASRLSDRINQARLPCKDQQQTNYCWVNGPTHCNEIVGVQQNEPMTILSPASAGAQIKNYRNVGGWGGEALDWIAAHGQDPIENWPANAISSRYATADNKAIALDYRITEWFVGTGQDQKTILRQLVSLLLRRLPCAVGYPWWSHEVTAVDAVWVNGALGIRIRNSWGMDWPTQGAGGYSVLTGSKMYPDDLVAPRSRVAA